MEATTEIIRRESLPVMIQVYNDAVAKIRSCFAEMDAAESALRTAFLDEFISIEERSYGVDWDEPEKVIAAVTRRCWGAIINRSEIKRYLTRRRVEELEKNIEDGHMPPLDVDHVWEVLQSGIANLPTFTAEIIKAAWELLRPRGDYKTNQKFQNEIGDRAILAHVLEAGYRRDNSMFRVRYGWPEDNLRTIQNAFALLDGQGIAGGYYGDLIDSINASPEGRGETQYFSWKGFSNRNLHLKFKRPELVAKMNATVGGSGITNKGGAQ